MHQPYHLLQIDFWTIDAMNSPLNYGKCQEEGAQYQKWIDNSWAPDCRFLPVEFHQQRNRT